MSFSASSKQLGTGYGPTASIKRSNLRGPESGLQILVPGRIDFNKIKQTSSLVRLFSVLLWLLSGHWTFSSGTWFPKP